MSRPAQLGILAGAALAVAAIGMLVAARSQPGDPPPAAVESSTTTVEATATTSTTTGSTPPEVTTTAPTPAIVAGAIEVRDGPVDFGAEADEVTISLFNGGDGPADWTITPSTPALSVTPGQGTLGPGETVEVRVGIDRSNISEGDIDEALRLAWDQDETTVDVKGSFEDNPVIHNPQARPAGLVVDSGQSCTPTRTTISARIRDSSPLESVVVRWNPGGGGQRETDMVPVGDDVYEAQIGPFTEVGDTSVRVVAFDDRGNAGGASITIGVAACG